MASIEKRGNTYLITVTNGTNIDGKKNREYITYMPEGHYTPKKEEKAVKDFADKFEERVKSGNYLSGEKVTLLEFTKIWLKEYAPSNLEESTLSSYLDYLPRILKELGNKKMAKITPLDLEKFYNKLTKDGSRTDGKSGGYSHATIVKHHRIISIILSTAKRWMVITSNPAESAQPPKKREVEDRRKTEVIIEYGPRKNRQSYTVKKKQFFTDEQVAILIDAISGEKMKYIVLLHIAMLCGLRKGELVGLTWDVVDFEEKTILVETSTLRLDGKTIHKKPKSKKSERLLSMPDFLVDLLKEYKEGQDLYKKSLGDAWKGENYLFIQDNGKQMSYHTPYNWFQRFLIRYNRGILENDSIKDKEAYLLPIVSIHGLRHTQATLLIAQKVDIKTVSSRLGHSKTGITLDYYVHSLMSADHESASVLNDMFKKNNANGRQTDGK